MSTMTTGGRPIMEPVPPADFTPSEDPALYVGPTEGMVQATWTAEDGVGVSVDAPDGLRVGFDLSPEDAARLRDQLSAVLKRLGL